MTCKKLLRRMKKCNYHGDESVNRMCVLIFLPRLFIYFDNNQARMFGIEFYNFFVFVWKRCSLGPIFSSSV